MAADLLAVWRKGCALSDAWFHLAPSERWRKFDFPEATRRVALDPRVAREPNIPEATRETASAELVLRDEDWLNADEDERRDMLNATARMIEVRSPTAAREAQSDMKAWLLQEMRGGRLAGIGRLSDAAGALHVVPGVLFDQRYVQWETSAVADDIRSFEGVMVVSAEMLHAEVGSPSRRTAGRPSKVRQVEEAIQALRAAGTAFNAMTRREACKRVRDYAHSGLGANTEEGFSDPVIQRALVRSVGTRFS